MGRIVTVILLGVLLCILLPASAWGWSTSAAQDYAHDYWSPYNSNFPNLSEDCAGFVSQCLHAHAAKDTVSVDPITGYAPSASAKDSVGVDWYYEGGTGYFNGWYSFWVNDNNPDNWAYTYNYSAADRLHYYMRDNGHFAPYRDLIGTYDFQGSAPPRDVSAMGVGAVISYDETYYSRGDGVFYPSHVAFVVHNNAHVHHDASSPYQGDLVTEHNTDRSHVLWQKGDMYNGTSHRQYWKLAAWELGTGLD